MFKGTQEKTLYFEVLNQDHFLYIPLFFFLIGVLGTFISV